MTLQVQSIKKAISDRVKLWLNEFASWNVLRRCFFRVVRVSQALSSSSLSSLFFSFSWISISKILQKLSEWCWEYNKQKWIIIIHNWIISGRLRLWHVSSSSRFRWRLEWDELPRTFSSLRTFFSSLHFHHPDNIFFVFLDRHWRSAGIFASLQLYFVQLCVITTDQLTSNRCGGTQLFSFLIY